MLLYIEYNLFYLGLNKQNKAFFLLAYNYANLFVNQCKAGKVDVDIDESCACMCHTFDYGLQEAGKNVCVM